jgi:hypothetical protein
MSRRDLAHIVTALWELSGGRADIGVSVAEIDVAIGRGRGDMRTSLNLQSLSDDGRAVALADGSWALTAAGVSWLQEDRRLSDR